MSTALKFSSLGVYRFVQEQVESALRPNGFSFDLARGMFLRSLGGEIEHFVTLPTDIADNHGPVVVTANLGVHCRPLSKRLALDHDVRRAHNLATITRNVGQLSAKRAWRDWIIRDDADAEPIARRLAARIVSVGLPWLARFDSLGSIAEAFRTFGREDQRQYAVPQLEQLLAQESVGDAPIERDDRNDGAFDRAREPAVLTLRVDRQEIAWHCDE